MKEGLDLALLAKLRWVEGLKIREIAALLGVSDSTVDCGLRGIQAKSAYYRIKGNSLAFGST